MIFIDINTTKQAKKLVPPASMPDIRMVPKYQKLTKQNDEFHC